MGLFDRVERKLESAVNGAFARAFRAEVQPVEIASAMRGAMDDRAAVVGRDRTIVPNIFVIDLAPGDYERLTSYAEVLANELVASVQEHAEHQRYVPGGPFHVAFRCRDDLETGVFKVRPATAKRIPTGEADAHAHAEELRHGQPFRASGAQAPALGPTGLASHAARAAAGSLASTAAAGADGAGPPGARAEPAQESPRARDQDLGTIHGPGTTPAPQRPAAPAVPASDFSGGTAPPPFDPAERPWLDYDGDHYPLLGALTLLGRDASADILVEDAGVSRRHAEIRVTHDGPHFVITVRDLGSTNGTFVNGDRVTTRRVTEGDRLTIGRTSLLIRTGRR